MNRFYANEFRLFPIKRLIRLLVIFAIVIQLAVITYNHFSGYYVLDDFPHFLMRLLRGFVLSMVSGFLMAYPDLFVISLLNKIAPWGTQAVKRFILQFIGAVGIALVISTCMTLCAHWLSSYIKDITNVLVNNAMIFAVVNIIMMSILEGWIYSIEGKQAKQKAQHLSEELLQIKFEVLKSQINPHFMFNSLNVLSGLIEKDTVKAQQFIDEFSHIYRYVLETIERPVIQLHKEVEFMRSYLFLQQIRYGENLTYSINIPSALLNMYLPPLSLQVVLENAIKHNTINESKPLQIDVYSEDHTLLVKNNIQPKVTMGKSTGLGLKNLKKRYALICHFKPLFDIKNDCYIAQLPLINIEEDESSNY